MSCKDCLQNCDKIVSDQCVQYTGPAIPLLGICTGDQITIYESNVATAVLSALDGTGIIPANITLGCSFLTQQLGILPPNLINLLQLLLNSDCTLNNLVVSIQAQIAAGQSGTVINTSCLTGLPTNPTQSDIIQAIINLLCTTVATIASFPSTYVQLTDLTSLVTPIVNQIINGGSNVTQYNSRMVPFVAYEYYGSLTNFDGNGIGLASAGFTKVYLCNNANGTPDKRGRVAVGAIRSVPGPALDPAVDPSANPNNPNWGLKDKAGETFHSLLVSEMPSHIHVVNDPQHTHPVPRGDSYNGSSQAAAGRTGGGQGTNPQPNVITGPSSTGITLASTGGSQPHNNIQPSIAAYYIMYIP